MPAPWIRLRRGVRHALRESQRRQALGMAQPRGAGTVTVARIIGNDLFPRHATGQTRRNLDLILQTEAALDRCDKLFVLNRWFDPAAADDAARAIRAAGHRVSALPFDPQGYKAAAVDLRFLDPQPDRALACLARMDPAQADRARLWAIRAKLDAAIGINAARNLARNLAGERGADWTLVLDGGCFLPEVSYAALRRDMAAAPFAPCLVIPMLRVADGDLTRPPLPDWTEEPQVALHRSARLRFDPRFPYGLRDKTALFTALGVPGPWDDWAKDRFLPAPEPNPERHRYKRASAAVLRLPSGGGLAGGGLEGAGLAGAGLASAGLAGAGLEGAGAQRPRHRARMTAICATIAHLDRLTGAEDAALTRRVLGV